MNFRSYRHPPTMPVMNPLPISAKNWLLLLTAAWLCIGASSANANGDLTAQEPIEVTVELGTTDDKLVFSPMELSFETSKLYKLILSNPSPQKHYFSSDALSRSVFTRKVQVNNAQGDAISEIKGIVREIEIYPGGTTEWWFVPVKTANISDLRCTIKGHTEAGMIGQITIK